MFPRWVKAEKCSDFEGSEFVELFLIALISVFFFFLFPRFHGLIQFCKSGEDCGIKRLRLKPCTQVSAFAEDRASLSFEVGRRGPDDPLGKLHRVEALGVQRHRTETLCQVSFLNFTAVLKWSQAEEHCENLFISSVSPAADPVFSGLFMEVFGATLAKDESGGTSLPRPSVLCAC